MTYKIISSFHFCAFSDKTNLLQVLKLLFINSQTIIDYKVPLAKFRLYKALARANVILKIILEQNFKFTLEIDRALKCIHMQYILCKLTVKQFIFHMHDSQNTRNSLH